MKNVMAVPRILCCWKLAVARFSMSRIFVILATFGMCGAACAQMVTITAAQRIASVQAVQQLRIAHSPLLLGAPGLLVAMLDSSAQASALGVQPGDILLRYDGQTLGSPEQFTNAVKARSSIAGGAVPVELLRGGAPINILAAPGRLGVFATRIVSLGAAAALQQSSNADASATQIFPQLGHPGAVAAGSVAISPDGKIVASSSSAVIKLWDVASGREMRMLRGHTVGVLCVAFSPDGRLLMSAEEGGIILWEVSSGEILYETKVGTYDVMALAFSPDGRTVAATGLAGNIILLDVASGFIERVISEPSSRQSQKRSIAYSPDGTQLLTAGHALDIDQHQVLLWDAVAGRVIRVFKGHSEQIQSVAFSPDGRRAVSSSSDKTLRIWDVATGSTVQALGTGFWLGAAAWSSDGRYIASVRMGHGVALWNAETGRMVRELKGTVPEGELPFIAFSFALSAKGECIGFGNGTLALWDLASGAQTKSFLSAAHSMSSLVISLDGRQFAVTGWREVINLWDRNDGKLARSIRSGLAPGENNKGAAMSAVRAAAISPDGRTMLVANNDALLRLADLQTGKELRVFQGHSGSVAAVAFSPDGQLAVSAGGFRDTIFKGVSSAQYDGSVRLWRVATGELVRVMKGHTAAVDSVTFSPDGKKILSTAYNDLRLWDTASGEALRVIQEPAVGGASFSPDGRMALVGGTKLHLVDLTTGISVRTFDEHWSSVSGAAFSADGTQALTGAMGDLVKLWDVASGKLLRTFKGHLGAVTAVAFSKNGHQVVSVSNDGTLRVWELASGRELVRMMSFKDGEWMSITPEGYFNASSAKATQYLNITKGPNVYGAGQFYDVFYRPDIVEAALAGNDTRSLVALTIDDAIRNPPPLVAQMQMVGAGSAEQVNLTYRVEAVGGGIGEIRIFHNGKLVRSDGVARPLPDIFFGKKIGQQTPDALVSQMRSFVKGVAIVPQGDKNTARPQASAVDGAIEIEPVPGDNELSIIAFNAENSIQSLVRTISFKSTRPPSKPHLYVLAIGIDKYKDNNVALQFAAKDARDFGQRWQQQSVEAYGQDNITLETLLDEQADRAGIFTKIDQIAARIKPTDHFVLFVASHGVLLAEQYYIVSNDYDGSLTPTKLISSAEIVEFSKRIKALSQLYILDTCHAGGMGGVVAGLYDSRVSVLAHKMGLHVFASASSTEEALDGFEGNGLFTHTLLSGLNNNRQADRNTDQKISVSELGLFSKQQTRELAAGVKHRQDPLIIGVGQDMLVYKLH